MLTSGVLRRSLGVSSRTVVLSSSMSTRNVPMFVAGKAVSVEDRGESIDVLDKSDYSVVVGRVPQATEQDIEDSFRAAESATKACREWPTYLRREMLMHVSEKLSKDTETVQDFARIIALEAGKPIRDALGEVQRCSDTFRLAADECGRMYGEHLPLDLNARGHGFDAYSRRFPIGVVSAITPFNFPLNLVAHKLAPALAVGCPFVLKPDDRTPLSGLMLTSLCLSAGEQYKMPIGAVSALTMQRELAGRMVQHSVPRMVTFTGSVSVGWQVGGTAVSLGKRTHLELGGNAAVIISPSMPDSSLDHIVQRLAFGGYYSTGQSCISVQRIYCHRKHYATVREKLAASVRTLGEQRGPLLDPATFMGVCIDVRSADRIRAAVADALSSGAASLLAGPHPDQERERERETPTPQPQYIAPMLLEHTEGHAESHPTVSEEMFGPLSTLFVYDDWEDVLQRVNASKFGLQCGVFTDSAREIERAYEELEVGGVVHNDISAARVDAQPYGGVKMSGSGREGVRSAMREFSEERILLRARNWTY